MDKELLQLDLTEIVRKRAGKKGKWIPRFLLRRLEKIIHQDELNAILRHAHPAEGSAFSTKVLEYLDIDVDVIGMETLSRNEPLVFASNHPLGGLDGIALVKVLGEYFGDDNIKVMVNDLLMNVTPLAGVFLPINKFGNKGARESSRLLNEAMTEGKQILMFPAGLVSRLHPGGEIKDLEWRKSFVAKALEFNRRIVPVKFEGCNSMKFYKKAKWRKKLGIKINLEQVLLPGEVCMSRGKKYIIRFGTPVDPAALQCQGYSRQQIVDEIYSLVYSMEDGSVSPTPPSSET